MFPRIPNQPPSQRNNTRLPQRRAAPHADKITTDEIKSARRTAWKDILSQLESKSKERQRAHAMADLALDLHAKAMNAREMKRQCARLNSMLDAMTMMDEEEAERKMLQAALESGKMNNTTTSNGSNGVLMESNNDNGGGDNAYTNDDDQDEGLYAHLQSNENNVVEDELFTLVGVPLDPPDQGETNSQDSADYDSQPQVAGNRIDHYVDAATKALQKMRRSLVVVVSGLKAGMKPSGGGVGMKPYRCVRHCRRLRYYRGYVTSLLELIRRATAGSHHGSISGPSGSSTSGNNNSKETKELRMKVTDLEHEVEYLKVQLQGNRGGGGGGGVSMVGNFSKEDFVMLDKISWKLEQAVEAGASFPGVDEEVVMRIIKEQRRVLADVRM